MHRAPRRKKLLFQPHIFLGGGVPILLHVPDLKHVQALQEGGQLGKAEVPHVEVRVALVQQVADLPNDDPVILVRVLPNDGPQGPADGAQAGAGLLNGLRLGLFGLLLGLGLLLGRLFLGGLAGRGLLLGGLFLLLLLLLGLGLLVGGGEDVQVFELVAGRDKGVGSLALSYETELLSAEVNFSVSSATTGISSSIP